MRPKGVRGRDAPGTREPPAVIRAPPPAASPAPESSTEPEPSPAQAPTAGQGAGSGSRSRSPPVLRPPAGVRPASQAGSGPRAQRASSFLAVQRNVQSAPRSSDAPWTPFHISRTFWSPGHWPGDWRGRGHVDNAGCLHRPAVRSVRPRARRLYSGVGGRFYTLDTR